MASQGNGAGVDGETSVISQDSGNKFLLNSLQSDVSSEHSAFEVKDEIDIAIEKCMED